MRLLVYGGGVLGSLYAARLQAAGHEVTILARGERLAQIQQHGIVLVDEETGQETTTPIRAVSTLEPYDDYDMALVLVRKDQVPSVLPALHTSRAIPAFLFLFNNAAGPDALIQAVGRERVLLGFPGAGGARDGHKIRCQIVPSQPTTIGELDGCDSERLEAIQKALEGAGFPVAVEPTMDAWLKTHVALVSPVANAMYYAGDNYKLAASPEGLRLLISAVKEGFRVLKRLGVPVVPKNFRMFRWMPTWVLARMVRRTFATQRAELVLWRHANVARAEMKLLADEFQALARQAGIPTPAIDQLYRSI